MTCRRMRKVENLEASGDRDNWFDVRWWKEQQG